MRGWVKVMEVSEVFVDTAAVVAACYCPYRRRYYRYCHSTSLLLRRHLVSVAPFDVVKDDDDDGEAT